MLVEEAEEMLRRIEMTSSSLSYISEAAGLDSVIFTLAFSDVQDLERYLFIVQQEMVVNSVPATFFPSSRLSARLRDISEKLGHVDRSFGLTAMVADVIKRKVQRECADRRSGFNRMSRLMNKMPLALDKLESLFETYAQILGTGDSSA